MKGETQTPMSTTSQGVPAIHYPLSYQGVGFVIVQAPDGTYEALAQGGYHQRGFASTADALAAVSAWIRARVGGVADAH